jgi:hypothetical protein
MRFLNILCGIAVLFTTLAYAHLLHHHFLHASREDHLSLGFGAGMFAALCAGILSFIGAILLLKRPR